jgi:hypothetical protein
LYERGVLREPDFGQVWGVALSDRGLRFVPLRDVYRAWTDLPAEPTGRASYCDGCV